MAPRSWDWWTEQKLDILSDYLSAFTRASQRAKQTVYLDLFAGRPDNVSRDREQRTIRGSARIALETQPPLTHLRFFELASNALRLERDLASEYPARAKDFQVIPGDCNESVASALEGLSDLNWAPTFAFLDQQSTEVRWTTIEALARHKRPDKWKTEIWLLCASGLLPRSLPLRTDTLDDANIQKLTRMFGTDIWLEALKGRRRNLLTGAEFRAELTNLMRWRLQNDLGYNTTLTFQVTNTGGSEIFDMIFASDHPVGEKIMSGLYKTARQRQPALRRQAQLKRQDDKLEEKGFQTMFELSEVGPAVPPSPAIYEVYSKPESPHPPWRMPR